MSMIGKIKKLQNGSKEYAFPVTVSDAVYVDMQTNLTTKLNTFTPTGTYKLDTFEQIKWGIKNDGTDSVNTTKGINNAISWALSNGYNHVVLPQGIYAVKPDWQMKTAIYLPSGIWFEMEDNCIVQMDTNSNPNYNIFLIDNVENVKLSGGSIKGDKLTHEFSISISDWVRGGINEDGSFNNDSTKIRSSVVYRLDNPDLLASWRLWKFPSTSPLASATAFNFHQYKKDAGNIDYYVGNRTDGVLASSSSGGRGWLLNPADQCTEMVFVIDISSFSLSDSDITSLSTTLDSSYATHEGGLGIYIGGSRFIEVFGIDISNCTGDAILTGRPDSRGNASNYTNKEEGNFIWIHGCDIHNCRRQGISLCGENDIFVYDNLIHDIGYADDGITAGKANQTAPGYGIDIESMVNGSGTPYEDPYYNKFGPQVNYRIYIKNNIFYNNFAGNIVNCDGTAVIIESNTFRGGKVYMYPTQQWCRYIDNYFFPAATGWNSKYPTYTVGNVYKIGDKVASSTLNYPYIYTCTSASGVTSTTEPTWLESSNVTDSVGNVWSGAFIGTQLTAMGDAVVSGNYAEGSQIIFQQPAGGYMINNKIKNGSFNVSDASYYFGMPTVDVTNSKFTVPSWTGGNGAKVCFEQWFGKVPTGIDPEIIYYTVNVSGNTFQVSTTLGGTPVTLSDAGTSGFHIARYNYGRIIVDGLYAENDWNNKNAYTGNTVTLNMAGGSVSNVVCKNTPLTITGQGSNYVGRPVSVNGITVMEASVSISNCNVNNIKAIRVKNDVLGGGLSLGNTNTYGRSNVSNSYFQGYGVILNNVITKDCTFIGGSINSVDTAPLATVTESYLENVKILMHFLTSSIPTFFKNTFKNIIIDAPTATFIDNVDLTTTLNDQRSTTTPSRGYFPLGKVWYNSNPTAGGYLGWVCTTAGYANNTPWVASLALASGYQINSGGHVYQAQNNGKTSPTSPAFPTSSGGNVVDNVGINTTWTGNTSYTVGALVIPSTTNGYYYECKTAGSSGSTEPTWSTSNGNTQTDGTVTWYVRGFITWKEVGTIATWKPFGLIST